MSEFLTWLWKQARALLGMQEAEDTSVISLNAIDIVSQEEPSFTDQFIDVLPDLKGGQGIQ